MKEERIIKKERTANKDLEKNRISQLTKKQKQFLQNIINFYNDNGRMPTIPEIMQITSMSQSNVYRNIRELLKKGYLAGTIKTLKILYTPEGNPFSTLQQFIRLPLIRLSILGIRVDDYIILDKKIIETNSEITVFDKLFLMRSGDDALKNIGITEKTLLVVFQKDIKDLKEGDIVALKYEGKLISRIYKQKEYSFYPLSALYAVIPLNEKVEVLGKVVASINTVENISEFY
ncbi:peptidase S24/S26A/S26B [Caldanaerobacter subterraneus]|uniref:Peptidase S24/S26A/S26B n=2 Tax=Caldanaerobacter subterraneus TaxID=911092 RepID=A0A7Y2L8N6_9THEO|nr:peptidase S24/S26A/S26B [Caldanaerobacter subterraneus]